MMKIFKSLAVIVAVAAIAGGGTYALFTYSETINGTFSAGTVKITAENPNGSLPFTVTNWAPGDTETLRIDIENTGSLDVKIDPTDVVASGFWKKNGVGIGDAYVSISNVYYWSNGGWVQGLPTSTVTLNSGGKIAIKVEVSFDINATNEYQGANYYGSVTILAKQADNN